MWDRDRLEPAETHARNPANPHSSTKGVHSHQRRIACEDIVETPFLPLNAELFFWAPVGIRNPTLLFSDALIVSRKRFVEQSRKIWNPPQSGRLVG